MAVRMELSRILIRELNDYQIIELREVSGGDTPKAPTASVYEAAVDESQARSFPIVIGLPEAQSIERRLKGITI
jgi:bifunctional DNase/RNase